MTRRQLIILLSGAVFTNCNPPASMNKTQQELLPTKYIDAQNPAIQARVAEIAPANLGQRERAIRIHAFVRDEIKFGWAPQFYDQKASEVLKSGIGFCNTKGTLFSAMLRAAGIPARLHFVNIHAAILDPFIDPGTPYVDHSFVEVSLDGRWISTDSYIVDEQLHTAGMRKLGASNKLLGYGIHRDGTTEWDGLSDSFSQYVNPSNGALTTRDYGIHEDVGAFYASGSGVNKLNVVLKLGFGYFAKTANSRIDAMRRAGME